MKWTANISISSLVAGDRDTCINCGVHKQLVSVGFQVLTAVVMKSSIFWDITPYSPLKVNRRFGVTGCLHLQGRRINQAINQREADFSVYYLLHAGFLLGLFFDPEYEGDIFLLNVGSLSTDCMALYPKRWKA
jgi:hypothetical protein